MDGDSRRLRCGALAIQGIRHTNSRVAVAAARVRRHVSGGAPARIQGYRISIGAKRVGSTGRRGRCVASSAGLSAAKC